MPESDGSYLSAYLSEELECQKAIALSYLPFLCGRGRTWGSCVPFRRYCRTASLAAAYCIRCSRRSGLSEYLLVLSGIKWAQMQVKQALPALKFSVGRQGTVSAVSDMQDRQGIEKGTVDISNLCYLIKLDKEKNYRKIARVLGPPITEPN